MKIAVAATAGSLEAPADPRFGRATCFVVVDTESGEHTVVENPGAAAGSGAGIQAAQTVANSGAEAVVAGNYGPNAAQTLAAGGLAVYQGIDGTVAECVDALKAGKLTRVSDATVPPHHGVGRD